LRTGETLYLIPELFIPVTLQNMANLLFSLVSV
jgi:hypothetical protein